MLVIRGKLKSTKIQKPLRPTEGGHGMLNNKMGLPGKNLGLMNMMRMTIFSN